MTTAGRLAQQGHQIIDAAQTCLTLAQARSGQTCPELLPQQNPHAAQRRHAQACKGAGAHREHLEQTLNIGHKATMAKSSSFSCSACNASFSKWSGRCEGCGEWNTISQTTALSTGPGKKSLGNTRGNTIVLSDLATKEVPPPRILCGVRRTRPGAGRRVGRRISHIGGR